MLEDLCHTNLMLAEPGIGGAGEALDGMRIAQVDLTCLPSAKEWRDLARDAAEPNPFFEGWYLKAALTHLRKDDVIRIAEFRKKGRLCGIFPLSVRSRYGRSPASNVGNWAHYQCFLGTPLIRAGYEQPFWRGLITELDSADWSGNLMSFSGLDGEGPVAKALAQVAAEYGRPCPVVHSAQRAVLRSELSAEAYLEAHVRGKKRKEWRRLENRLADLGAVSFSVLANADDLDRWCADFLALEAAGWKGQRGAAMANTPETQRFFVEVVRGAQAEGLLEMQRLDLDGRAIAMLVNFLTPPGSWSFKIAYDEELGRFSPGVMIELRNMERILSDPELDWMDSCAVEDHPMIDGIWAERRSIVQISVPLSGMRRRAVYSACRAAETGSATFKKVFRK